jgi:hypothetical protein
MDSVEEGVEEPVASTSKRKKQPSDPTSTKGKRLQADKESTPASSDASSYKLHPARRKARVPPSDADDEASTLI